MLEERGISVSYPTIAQWVREGRFSGAIRDETERGPVWRIPLVSVKNFEPPKIGRPPASGTDGKVTIKPSKKKGSKR